jgi:hypothetical protein
MLCVRFAPATADRDDLMPGSDQSRDQVRSYMSGTTNDDDTHRLFLFANITLEDADRSVKGVAAYLTNPLRYSS